MKILFRFGVLALLGIVMALLFVRDVAAPLRHVVIELYRWTKIKVTGAFSRLLAKLQIKQMLRAPSVLLVSAKFFVLRLVRREAPRIEAGWRICPST